MIDRLCYRCKTFREIVYVDGGTGQEFCRLCALIEQTTFEELATLLLADPTSPIGPPFAVGDVVEARTAGVVLDGTGTVQEMSMSLDHGGTPVYPTWRVALTDKAYPDAPDEAWYTEVCLTKVKQEVSSD